MKSHDRTSDDASPNESTEIDLQITIQHNLVTVGDLIRSGITSILRRREIAPVRGIKHTYKDHINALAKH